MPPEPNGSPSTQQRWQDILETYRKAAETGQVPDRQELLTHHPDLAEKLTAFFAEQDQLTRQSESRRATLCSAPEEGTSEGEATIIHTPVVEPTVASGEVRGRYLGNYELLEELGRGGMGVVYKARQRKLERLVAVKMILTGDHAGADELARFRTEAEAVARLHHPNIVHIYEVGEHEGHPYFSLEFCPGGSLDHQLRGTPRPPQEAAALLETLARAMSAAHQAGIVHRDLKPANVLLAADGTPKISDFGLAKKLSASAEMATPQGLTASGVILGTPSYMAPEQALGYNKEIGPGADVYALGAILYELLTGRPPFKAATPLDTILQVIHDEPVSPRQLQSRTPRDLETVCLKCLHKDALRRYPSAQALADDLHRFREGRPIAARPVGRLERAARWVRRNPVLAGMTALVVLALLGGTAISTAFGLAALQQAELARKNEADAVATGQQLRLANETLTRTADDLQHSRDELETTLAQSLIRPLGVQGSLRPLTEPEWEALWQLATHRRGRLGYRFVEEASRSPVTSRQLRDRAALALSTAVGLDEERRAEVEALLLARLDDPALEDDQKKDLALAAAAWDGLSRPAALRIARQLTRTLNETSNFDPLRGPTQSLAAVVDRLNASDAATTNAQTAATLLQAMQNPGSLYALEGLTQNLAAVTSHMEARDATATNLQAAALLVQAMKQDPRNARASLPALAYAVSAVTARLAPRDAAPLATQAATLLVQAMKDSETASALPILAQALPALTRHTEARDAALLNAQAATILLQALKDSRNINTFSGLARSLSALTARLEPTEAAPLATQAATLLLQAMKDSGNANTSAMLAQGLAAVLGRMEARDAALLAAQATTILLQPVKERRNVKDFPALAQGLSALADHLQPSDVPPVASVLLGAMKDTQDPPALRSLAQGLSAVAGQGDPRDTAPLAQAATILLQAMKDTRKANTLPELAQGLLAVAEHLEPRNAAALLLQALQDPRNAFALSRLAEGLALTAERMDPREAATTTQAATLLLQAMKDPRNTNELPSLAHSLSALADHMEARDAAVTTGAAAPLLLQAMKDPRNSLVLLAQGLSALAHHMEVQDAHAASAEAAALLLQAMKNPRNASDLGRLARVLAAVAAQMEPRDAAATSAQAANTLMRSMKDTNPPALESLAEGLSALLSFVPRGDMPAHFALVASAATSSAGTGDPLTALTLLLPAADPSLCHLSPQQLVELLKIPGATGPVRRVLLKCLGARYQRTFADSWEFVRFAREQNLGLDLTTPPQPSEPVALVR